MGRLAGNPGVGQYIFGGRKDKVPQSPTGQNTTGRRSDELNSTAHASLTAKHLDPTLRMWKAAMERACSRFRPEAAPSGGVR